MLAVLCTACGQSNSHLTQVANEVEYESVRLAGFPSDMSPRGVRDWIAGNHEELRRVSLGSFVSVRVFDTGLVLDGGIPVLRYVVRVVEIGGERQAEFVGEAVPSTEGKGSQKLILNSPEDWPSVEDELTDGFLVLDMQGDRDDDIGGVSLFAKRSGRGTAELRPADGIPRR